MRRMYTHFSACTMPDLNAMLHPQALQSCATLICDLEHSATNTRILSEQRPSRRPRPDIRGYKPMGPSAMAVALQYWSTPLRKTEHCVCLIESLLSDVDPGLCYPMSVGINHRCKSPASLRQCACGEYPWLITILIHTWTPCFQDLVIVRLRVLGVAGLQIRSSMMKDFKKSPWSYRSAPSDRSVLSLCKDSS